MQYSLEFTKQLVEAADTLKGTGRSIEERKRAVLYLSLLSIEISLKYLLEKAGVFVKEIKKRRHDISALLLDLDGCEIETGIVRTGLYAFPGDPPIQPAYQLLPLLGSEVFPDNSHV